MSSVVGCRFDAEGRRFLVTGAAGTIGRVLVSRFAAAGAHVVALDSNQDALDAVAAAWPANVTPVEVDLADVEAVHALDADPRLRDIDLLVNNAAVTWLRTPLIDTDAHSLDLLHGVNVRAAVLLSQLVARRWRASGEPGCIVNLSSPGASRAHADQAGYDGTKGAIEALTRAMAVEWGRYGIRVNAIAPASVVGDRIAVTDAPLGVSTAAADVADAALWLASDAAKVVTGHVLALDGGLLAQLRTPVTPVPGPAHLRSIDNAEVLS